MVAKDTSDIVDLSVQYSATVRAKALAFLAFLDYLVPSTGVSERVYCTKGQWVGVVSSSGKRQTPTTTIFSISQQGTR